MHQLEDPEATIHDLMALPDGQKAELIDGEIYMMAPVTAKHSLAASELTAKIRTYTSHDIQRKGPTDTDSWIILSEAWTYYDEHNSFVHDIAGFSRKALAKLPDTGPIMVRPIWVCEILSPSNWMNDTQRKRVALEEHGVPYYWLVDPLRKNIQILELKKGNEHYQIIQAVENANSLVKLPPFENLELTEFHFE